MLKKAPAAKATGAGREHSPALTWLSLAGLLASRARLCFTKRRQFIPNSDNSPWSCRTKEDSRKEPDSDRLREHPLEAERSWPDFDDEARPSRRRASSRWHMVPVAASATTARTPS